jgi:hypothetical protein
MAYPELAWGEWSAGVEERGHAGKGRPGTWEASFSPSLVGGAGAAVEAVQASGVVPVPGSEQGQGVVLPSEGNEVRRDGRRGVGVH